MHQVEPTHTVVELMDGGKWRGHWPYLQSFIVACRRAGFHLTPHGGVVSMRGEVVIRRD